jgi:hypothetical protein
MVMGTPVWAAVTVTVTAMAMAMATATATAMAMATPMRATATATATAMRVTATVTAIRMLAVRTRPSAMMRSPVPSIRAHRVSAKTIPPPVNARKTPIAFRPPTRAPAPSTPAKTT